MTNTQLKEIKKQLEYLTTAYEQDDLIAIKKIALTMEYTIQVLIENTVEAIETEDGNHTITYKDQSK